jgi:hypothetical protein
MYTICPHQISWRNSHIWRSSIWLPYLSFGGSWSGAAGRPEEGGGEREGGPPNWGRRGEGREASTRRACGGHPRPHTCVMHAPARWHMAVRVAVGPTGIPVSDWHPGEWGSIITSRWTGLGIMVACSAGTTVLDLLPGLGWAWIGGPILSKSYHVGSKLMGYVIF